MKNSLERLNNRLEHVEDRNRIEDRSIEVILLEEQKEKRMKENKKISKRPVEHNHVYQQMHNVCPKRRGEREGKKWGGVDRKKYLKK